MRVRVKEDKTIHEVQVGFNFLKCLFTIYTPENINKKLKNGQTGLTIGDQLRNQLVDRLPSAEARLALTMAEVCSLNDRKKYIETYLPSILKKKRSKN